MNSGPEERNCHRMVPGPTGPLDGHERKLHSPCDLHKPLLRHMDHSDIWDLLELVSAQRQCPVTNPHQHFSLPKPLNPFLYRTPGRSCILSSFTMGQLLVHVSDNPTNQTARVLPNFLSCIIKSRISVWWASLDFEGNIFLIWVCVSGQFTNRPKKLCWRTQVCNPVPSNTVNIRA